MIVIQYNRRQMLEINMPKCFWVAFDEETQEAYDYNPLSVLIRDLNKEGLEWRVERLHKDGSRTVINRSKSKLQLAEELVETCSNEFL